MGRLAGFNYRAIVKRLNALGFGFHRQAAGSHEISIGYEFADRRKKAARYKKRTIPCATF